MTDDKAQSPAPTGTSAGGTGPIKRLRLRERRVDFVMLYRELHYCYGRMLGMEGIALWSWYRLHQHGGGKYEELTGYGWTGQPSIMRAHGIKHHTTMAKIRDRLIEADLLVLARALDVFTEEELDAMRQHARERGERLKLQKGSYLAFVHDPLTREDFVAWTEGSQCATCPISRSCMAHKAWQAGEGTSNNDTPMEKESVSKNDIPDQTSMSKSDTPDEQGMSENDRQGMSKSDTYPDRKKQNDNNSGIVALLVERGITERVARRLAREFSEARILAKIELLDYMLKTNPSQVSQNPAGYLRKAIEEDYAPPAGFKTRAEREAEEVERAQERVEKEARRSETMAQRRTTDFRQRVIEQYGVSQELQGLWARAKAELAPQMSMATYHTYIEAHTVLISLEEGVARIATNNRYIQEWLAHRLNRVVKETLEGLTGQGLELEFVVVEANGAE